MTSAVGNRNTTLDRRWALIVALTLLGASAGAIILGRARGPDANAFLTVAAMTWAFCDLFTAFLLFVQCKIARRAELGVVGMACALSGLLTFPYLGAFFGLLGTQGRTLGDQQVPSVIFLLWHAAFPCLVVASHAVASRASRIGDGRAAARLTLTFVASVFAFAAWTTVLAFSQRDALPHFLIDGELQWPWKAGAALAIVLNACGVALFLVRNRLLTSLEIWLGVVMFGTVLEGILNESTLVRFTYAYDFGKAIAALTASIVIGRLAYDNIRLYARSVELVTLQSQQAAARLRAIWQVATSDGLRESDYVQVALDVAIANIRPGKAVFGFMSHLSTDRIVVDAVSACGNAATLEASLDAYAPGRAFPIDSDVHRQLQANGGVMAWHRPRHLAASLRCGSLGWKGALGVAIPVGTETHFFLVGVLESLADQPFTEEDSAFVHVVASNLSHYFHARSSRERAQFASEHDLLTGLCNRMQCLRLARTARGANELFAILLIDIDQLRYVNARLGQLAGDQLLVNIAAALGSVHAGDVVCRFGGDEFTVIMQREPDGQSLDERLRDYADVFSRPFSTPEIGQTAFVSVSASLGAVAAAPDMSVADMIECAHVARDEAKAGGAGGSVIYNLAMKSALDLLVAQRAELLQAIDEDQLRLHYQPTYAMSTRSIVGAEALVRWQHPTRGLLQPGSFLPAAERAKVMVPLTAWIVHRIACDFRGETLPVAFRCHFNVGATVLEDKAFLAGLEEELQAAPGLGARLGIEVTESEVMSNVERAIEALQAVRKLGLVVAIDDFGTGYSSLNYLKRLPIDSVKLDRSFIDGLPDNPSDIALAEMFVELTRRFGLASVAEGIENEQQAAWLNDHGCMVGQGFLFSKPLPFAEFRPLLERSVLESLLRSRSQVELGLS